MKKSLLIFASCLLMSTAAMAQAPELFNYQGIAHDESGSLNNKAIGIKISIVESTANGTILYSERQVDTTNNYGLYNIAIGAGTPLNSTSWSNINWSSGDKYIKVEIDPNGGTTYANLGTTQLLSVPYALFAENTPTDTSAWSTSGNIVDTAAFIGTLNSMDIRFKRGGIDVGRIQSNNVTFGVNALNPSTTGYGNFSVGQNSLKNNTTGSFNNVLGAYALENNTTGSYNNAIGESALYQNTTGDYNIAIGRRSLYQNTTGKYNNAFGLSTLENNKTGEDNNAFGNRSLYNNTTGDNNNAIGDYSLRFNTTGNENVGFGRLAGSRNRVGSYLTMVGASANVRDTNYSYSGAFGYGSQITASNQYRIGSLSSNGPTSIGGKVAWSTVSDGRFKTNVKEDVAGLAFIKQLRPVTYKLDGKKIEEFIGIDRELVEEQIPQENTEQSNEIFSGFIAQEVEATAEKLDYNFHGVDKPKNDKDYYGLRYAEFVVPLVKAVQEQQNIIDTQDERIKKLENMVQRLLDEKE